MTASRADARRRRALGGVAVVLAVAGMVMIPAAGWAQIGPPKLIIPGNRPGSARPSVEAPPALQPTQPQPVRPGVREPSGSAAPGGIQVDPLRAVSEDGVGPLDPTTGGLDADLWRGVGRRHVARLLALLPGPTASKAQRALERRLLLTNAAMPAATDEADRVDLLVPRARLLLTMGDRDGLDRLLRVVPQGYESEALARIEADHFLLAQDLSRACRLPASWVTRSGDRYWQKLLVFCEALAGAWDQVELGVRLLQEIGENDPMFFALVQGLPPGAKAGALPEVTAPRAIDVAMLRIARLPLPAPAPDAKPSRQADDYMVGPLLADSRTPFAEKLAIAEAGEARGVIDVAALTALYESVDVASGQLDRALSIAEADPSPYSRALLFRATLAQPGSLAQAQATARALSLARQQGTFSQAARLYGPVISGIEPNSALGWFAAPAARALYVSGRAGDAERWYRLAEREASRSPEAAVAWHALWPIARLANGDAVGAWDASALDAWWKDVRGQEPHQASEKAVLLFAMLRALGDEPGDAVWRDLATAPTTVERRAPAAAVAYALQASSDSSRVGETVALAVAALGDGDLRGFAPDALATVTGILFDLGLDAEARALALEAVLAAGI
jgi:hypothetical protein